MSDKKVELYLMISNLGILRGMLSVTNILGSEGTGGLEPREIYKLRNDLSYLVDKLDSKVAEKLSVAKV